MFIVPPGYFEEPQLTSLVFLVQLAIRAKRHMLGNIRFIGELFKIDMLKVHYISFAT